MTLVFIENILGGSQAIVVIETFGEKTIEHRLAPGENLKIAVSRFKAIVIDEAPAQAAANLAPPVAQRRELPAFVGAPS